MHLYHSWIFTIFDKKKNTLISNYSQRASLCLFNKHKYVNGICEPHMDNYDINERWY